jgi:CubicO group peptidase (beta-lactamase class C family)
VTSRDYWPTDGWRTADPESVGLDGAALRQVLDFAEDCAPLLTGLVVVRSALIVFEHYFRGFHEGSYHHVASITKSVVSALVGIALERGLIAGLDQPIIEFFPEFDTPDADPRTRRITIKHLLTMTGGWSEMGESSAERAFLPSIVQTAFRRPMAHEPGTVFHYDSLGCHLLSVILGRVTSMGTAEFAREALFRPLGIWRDDTGTFLWRTGLGGPHNLQPRGNWDEKTGLSWWVDGYGNTTGWGGLHLTVRDLAKFGYLYLNEGAWDGSQIVPPGYLKESVTAQNAGGPGPEREPTPYGYLWWVPGRPHGLYYGWGAGRQHVYVLPELDMVVAMTAHQGRNDPGRILERFIVPSAI